VLKIPGIDPLVMQRIRERTTKQIVHDSEKPKVAEDKYKKQGQEYEEQYSEQRLEELIEELNELFEEENAPIRFKLVVKDDMFKVQILDHKTKKIIKEVSPHQVLRLVRRHEDSRGIILDTSI